MGNRRSLNHVDHRYHHDVPPHTLAPLLAALRGQSVPPRAIWAWANEPSPEMSAALAAEVARLPAGLDRVVTSSDNAYIHGRFALALLAPSEYVAVFDDDSLPGPRWFENCLQTMAERPGILGTAGLVLDGAGYARRTMHGWQRPSDAAVEVDFVCQAWFLRREWLHYLFAAPAVTGRNGEDIELAARAWRLGGIGSFCPPHPAADRGVWGSTQGMELGLDAAAASRRPRHEAERDRIVRAEIAAGWKPLRTRNGVGWAPPTMNRRTGHEAVGDAHPTISLDGTLEREADPLACLRRLRQQSPERALSCSISNVRHRRRVAALSVQRGQPYGGDAWARATAARLGLESTFRARPP